MRRLTRNNEGGASLVEFAIICLLFFATIGFFIELSIAYFNYQLLVSAATQTARRTGAFATKSIASDTCVEIENDAAPEGAAQRAKDFLKKNYGVSQEYFGDVRFCGDVRKDAVGRCYIRIRGKWPFRCFFCLFYKGGAVLNAEGEAYIEDECFACDTSTECSAAKTQTNCNTPGYDPSAAG